MIIAIDGPAASGKGTLARRLAKHYRLAYLDSGSLYRAVAATMLAAGLAPDDEAAAISTARALDGAQLDDLDLRSAAVGAAASVVAAFADVRAALLTFQRHFAQSDDGAVLDGRDIGTVVLPRADAKLYIVADIETRARRRAAELNAAGQTVSQAQVSADLAARDARDAARATAPMKQAEDALLLDTSNLDIEAAFQAALTLVEAQLHGRSKNPSLG
ncbi:MAG: (d)CMP kinase [Hyphomicrobiales bacterium]